MKLLAALAVILWSGLTASAQIVNTVTYIPTTLTLNMPCANHGKGLTLTFSGKAHQMFHENLVNGTGVGGQFYTARDFTAKLSNGTIYYLTGTHDGSVLNWTPRNPDGSLNTDGDYTYVDTFILWAYKGPTLIEQFLFRHTQAFSVSNNGNNLSDGLDETVCK